MKRPVHVLIDSDHAQNSEPDHCTIEHPGSFRLYTTDSSPVALHHRRIHSYPPTPHVLHTSTCIHQLRTCYTQYTATDTAPTTGERGFRFKPIAPSTQEPAQLIRPTRPAKCVSCPAILTVTLLMPIQSLYIPACPGPPWHTTYQLDPVHPGTLTQGRTQA